MRILFMLLAACGAAACGAAAVPPPLALGTTATACRDLPGCEAECTRAGGESCTSAAAMMRAQPLATDPLRYARALDGACTSGHARSCWTLGQLVVGSPATPRDEARAQAAYVRGCALGDGISCFAAVGTDKGWEHRIGPARQVLTTGCERRDGRSCAVLGVLALMVDRDREASAALGAQAADYLEASCRAGDVDECMTGARQINGFGAADSAARIKPLLDRGCELGDGEACMLIATNDTALDDDARAKLYGRGCELGRAEACLILAKDALDAGRSGARAQLEHGIALAEARCTLADEAGCTALAGVVVFEGLSAVEAARAVDLVDRACDRHGILACVQLAKALDRGPAERRDAARIRSLEDRACKLGYPFACPTP